MAWRDGKVHAANRGNSASNLLNPVGSGIFRSCKAHFQDLASLFFHGDAMPRGTGSQPFFDGIFQTADRDAGHVPIIQCAITDCTTSMPDFKTRRTYVDPTNVFRVGLQVKSLL